MSTEWLQEARDAIDGFVAGLQAGIDSADAQTYNADFAEDVMWGWCVGTEGGGSSRARTLPFARRRDGAGVVLPTLSDSI
jgi:hypothetical protein